MIRLLLAALLLLPSTPSFQQALPGHALHFPSDDHPHANFANEWWYFTGNLATSSGRQFGFELTFFRVSPAPGTDLKHQLYFTHFAISDIAGHHFNFWTRARHGDWSQAGVSLGGQGFSLYSENWRATFDATGPRHLAAAWGGLSLDLSLEPGGRTLHGKNGWSQKGTLPTQASYYYSFTHIEARGRVQTQPVAGLVWMDHEFASNQLSANQQGWVWMGLHLSTGDLMLFNLRQTSGARDSHSAGTWQPLAGTAVPLAAADFQMAPIRWWQAYPVDWKVSVPRLHLAFTIAAALDQQELHDPVLGVSYWEGAVSSSSGSAPARGYLELTGYRHRFTWLQ